jgi:hypothetical protein
LEGDQAIDLLLSFAGDAPSLVPPDAEMRYRVTRWLRNVPKGLGVGDGRDDIAYNLLAFLVRDLALPDAQALDYAEELWDRHNAVPKGRTVLAEILVNVHAYGRNGYGSGLGGNGKPPPPPQRPRTAQEASRRPAAQIILEHLREVYQPAFRRGDMIWSAALGMEVRRSVALARTADSEVVARLLADAIEMPRDEHGNANRSLVPKLFRD